MNLGKIYHYVQELKRGKVEYLDKLDKTLVEMIKKQKVQEVTKVKRYNTAIKLLDTVKKNKPILGLTHVVNDTQIFTDTYIAFMLRGEDIIPELKTTKEYKLESEYPSVKGLFKEPRNYTETVLITCEQIKEDLKFSNKKILYQFNDSLKVMFDKKRLQYFLDIMNFKKFENVTFHYSPHTNPMLLYARHFKSEGLIVVNKLVGKVKVGEKEHE